MMGAQYETFMGLSGVGDTFGTCLGALSRNRLDEFSMSAYFITHSFDFF